MSNSPLRILGIEMSIREGDVGQWTETPTKADLPCASVCSPSETGTPNPFRMVTVKVKDVIDALVGPSGHRPAWLDDFQDDPIAVTEDLFEVLVAYRHMKRAA